jgi:recombinational DNA repair protein (RecF pathway)
MKLIAIRADSMPAMCRFGLKLLAISGVVALLTACAGVGTSVGISVPIGRMGGVGVSIGSGGTVSGSVGVGAGGGSVSVGASGQLPKPAEKKPETEAEKQEAKKP